MLHTPPHRQFVRSHPESPIRSIVRFFGIVIALMLILGLTVGQ
jgi:hypothetical protein